MDGIENYEVFVKFAETTPIDEVRNTQMMILRLQNNLVSIYQALEEMGDENPFDHLPSSGLRATKKRGRSGSLPALTTGANARSAVTTAAWGCPPPLSEVIEASSVCGRRRLIQPLPD